MSQFRKVFLISDDEEKYKALSRALMFLSSTEIHWLKSHMYHISLPDKEPPIILDTVNIEILSQLLWQVIRLSFLNPILAIGTMAKHLVEEKEEVFKKFPFNHVYFEIPFRLPELIEKMVSIKPIYDEDTRKIIFNHYSTSQKAIWRKLDHDLPKANKKQSIGLFKAARDFWKARGDQDVVGTIENGLKEIEVVEKWYESAANLSEYLKAQMRGIIDG